MYCDKFESLLLHYYTISNFLCSLKKKHIHVVYIGALNTFSLKHLSGEALVAQ